MFYIEPTSGLCNRLRVIQSAYLLAQQSGQQLTVVWNCKGGMNIPMEELFTIPSEIKVITFRYFPSNKLTYILKRLKYKAFSFLMKHRKKCLYISEPEMFKIKEAKEEDKLPGFLSANKDVYIKTCSELIALDKCDIFSPSKQVLSKLSEVQEYCRVNADTVGIHIRRTDNEQSILHSPTYLFEQRMTELLTEKPETKFYLATDSPEEEAKLKAEFGNSIITFNNKDVSRTTKQGQIDAYVELLLLSRCGELWGSYFSSFSTIAAKIGQIKLERIMK